MREKGVGDKIKRMKIKISKSKKLKISKHFIFSLILIFTTYWIPITLTLLSLFKEKEPIKVIIDQRFEQLISNKTKVKVSNIKLMKSERLFGMMIGIPTFPQLILSSNLYKEFTPGELEYVILHEAGHYQLQHGLKEVFVLLILLFIGILILKKIKNEKAIFFSLILGLVFGIVMIRFGRIHEYQADYFALERMENPEGLISATNKFKESNNSLGKLVKNKLIEELFFRSNPYNNRIRMAREEIEKKL